MALLETFKIWQSKLLTPQALKEKGMFGWIKQIISAYSKFLIILAGLIVIYVGFYLTLGYSYIASFEWASNSENPGGFMLLVNPGNYFVTRLEDILDILYFFGPVLTVLFVQGLRTMKQQAVKDEQVTPKILHSFSSLTSINHLVPNRGSKKRRNCTDLYVYSSFSVDSCHSYVD